MSRTVPAVAGWAPRSPPWTGASSTPAGRQTTSWAGASLLIEPLVDAADLGHPPLPLTMVQLHDLVTRPVKVIGEVRYLLVQPLRGVAHYSPRPVSTSNSPAQWGQATCRR